MIHSLPRLLDSPEWGVMCAVAVTPAIHLPDFLCEDFENLDKLVMAGEVYLAAGKAERLEELCDLLQFRDMVKEEVVKSSAEEEAEETEETATSGELQQQMLDMAEQVLMRRANANFD
jgi:hypothetical protein